MSKEKERLFSAIAAEETFFMFSKNELVFSGFYSSSRKSKEQVMLSAQASLNWGRVFCSRSELDSP